MSLTLVQGYDSDNDERMLRERRTEEVFSDEEEEEERDGDGQAEGGEEAEAEASGRGRGNLGPTNGQATGGGSGRNGSVGSRTGSSPRPVQHPPALAPKVGKTGLPSASFAFDEVPGAPEFLRPAALVSAPALSEAAASVAGITGAHTSAPHRSSEGASGNAYPVPSATFSSGAQASGSGKVQTERESRGAGSEPGSDPGAGAGVGGRKAVGAPTNREGGQKKRDKEGGVKDKEKMKRMKGQSSHATWKSETEMQLRQTYD